MKKILILTFFGFLSCDITENRWITVYNNSNNEICSFITNKEIDEGNLNSEIDIAVDIKKKEFGTINPVRTKWEEYIKKCDDKKIRLYIVSNDSVKKYGWHDIYVRKNYNKRYLLTIEDLEKINWEINYK